ncbi:NAD-dependent epimerase/dehydratase family protein [Streptomyces candidus]|uniref:dTDP-glucose 4,6-dehydratase n=1 Tax=Streptomyces candidus TaxID=67283 RepID=A0A7X0LRU2_9ACTN|nr:NAD-dependent epimerase/dehydratase family protein [Streptomyces candidus]MBB6438510.1 dTDP-glucose 4,6-dehydratase [Streptomyces candidus]GHH45631.1 epimerase [Streptomyces candidus]
MTPTTFSLASQPPQPPLPWQRALVTAGAGFLGSHLCERLLDAGVAVDCVDETPSATVREVQHLAGRPGFRPLRLNLARPGGTDVLAGPYDLVVHFGCPASAVLDRPAETLGADSLVTRHALGLAERDGARFLLVSTCLLHGVPPGRDGQPDGAVGADERARHAAEASATAYVSDTKADAGIARVFPVYGPRMGSGDGLLIPGLIRQALGGGPVTVPGDAGGRPSLCYVDDTVDGVLLVAASRSVRPVDIGGDPGPTVEEIARRVLDLTGSDARPHFAGHDHESPEPPRPATGFAHELLGWTPRVSLADGLARTVAYFLDRAAPYGRGRGGRSTPGTAGGVRHACTW